MKIVRLQAENIKRLSAVEIVPDQNTVVIGGRNAQGKTSILDAIEMTLGGQKAIPAKPVRRGAKKGHVVLELDDLIVRRTFTDEGATSLTVSTKQGAKYSSPQGLLDSLVGRLTFDPLRFLRLEAREQAKTLRDLSGLDTTELDQERQELYDQRTELNREAKRLESLVASKPLYQGVPAEPINSQAILGEIQSANRNNSDIEALNLRFRRLVEDGKAKASTLDELKAEQEALVAKIAKTTNDLDAMRKEAADLRDLISHSVVLDTKPMTDQLGQIEETNRKVQANRERHEAELAQQENKLASEHLTGQLDKIEEKKRTMLAEANLPVQGIAFDDNGVTLNGLPFDQASGAEQLRASVEICAAMNPKLRIMLCRDGSLLDQDSLDLLRKVVAERDFQLWLETVGSGSEVSVIIEDGRVRNSIET